MTGGRDNFSMSRCGMPQGDPLQFKLAIGGRLVEGARRLAVINPATEEPVAFCHVASVEQLEVAFQLAKQAFPCWSSTPLAMRQSLIAAIAAALESRIEELAA